MGWDGIGWTGVEMGLLVWCDALCCGGDERTKADKLYYDKCLAAQKASRLPDHCNADAFTKRAMAFVLSIMPNLAQR